MSEYTRSCSLEAPAYVREGANVTVMASRALHDRLAMASQWTSSTSSGTSSAAGPVSYTHLTLPTIYSV